MRSVAGLQKAGTERKLEPECVICGVVGRATACDCGVVGSIPTGGALEVWPWTFGFRTAWLINKSAGLPPFCDMGRVKHTSDCYGGAGTGMSFT
jgi:hypothetical protein